jgi:phospholipid/cholesterol/gamma-HCH transport system substrate-binding protein
MKYSLMAMKAQKCITIIILLMTMSTLKNNRPAIVGLFILLGLSILVVTIFTLGGEKKTFAKTFTVHAVFSDVGGLLKGGNVWFSGVKVGTVKSIRFYGNAQVEVIMSIEKNAQSFIHQGAKARIGSDGLIGNKIIIIYGGDESLPSIGPNDMLAVDKSLNTDDILATLQANNMNLLEITKDFKNISQKIDSGNGTIATLLNDPAMAGKLLRTVDDLGATVANFRSVSINSKNVLANMQTFSDNLNKPGNSINDLVTDTSLFKEIKGTLAQLEKASADVSSFSNNLKKVGNKLNEGDNVAGVLLNDSVTAASVREMIRNLETSSKKLDENLEALQHNFLLRGFFRKKAKAEKAAAL